MVSWKQFLWTWNNWICWLKITRYKWLVNTNVLNTKVSEVEKKNPDTSILVTKIVLNTKISEVENKSLDNSKYITT